MNIEPLVRETIQTHAGDAPPADGLGAAAWRRARRRRTRRVVATATAAAVVVALGAVGTRLVELTQEQPALVPAAPGFGLPRFPYTPGWVPDGLTEGYVTFGVTWDTESALGPQLDVVHERAGSEPTGEPPPLVMTAYPVEPIAYLRSLGTPLTRTEPVTVRGRAATLVSGDGPLLIAWQERPDQWLSVSADPEIGRDGLLRYVAALIPAPLPVTLPATLAVVPDNAELVATGPSFLRLQSPAGWGAVPHDTLTLISLHKPADVGQLRPAGPVTTVELTRHSAELVQGDEIDVLGFGGPAALARDDRFAFLSLPVAPDLMVTIASSGLELPDLLAFAEGLAVTPAARPQHFPDPGW